MQRPMIERPLGLRRAVIPGDLGQTVFPLRGARSAIVNQNDPEIPTSGFGNPHPCLQTAEMQRSRLLRCPDFEAALQQDVSKYAAIIHVMIWPHSIEVKLRSGESASRTKVKRNYPRRTCIPKLGKSRPLLMLQHRASIFQLVL